MVRRTPSGRTSQSVAVRRIHATVPDSVHQRFLRPAARDLREDTAPSPPALPFVAVPDTFPGFDPEDPFCRSRPATEETVFSPALRSPVDFASTRFPHAPTDSRRRTSGRTTSCLLYRT